VWLAEKKHQNKPLIPIVIRSSISIFSRSSSRDHHTVAYSGAQQGVLYLTLPSSLFCSVSFIYARGFPRNHKAKFYIFDSKYLSRSQEMFMGFRMFFLFLMLLPSPIIITFN
jgi:hypothetical protein